MDERYTMSAVTAKGEEVDLWVDALSGEIVLRDMEHTRGS
jgi:hypothetical protein